MNVKIITDSQYRAMTTPERWVIDQMKNVIKVRYIYPDIKTLHVTEKGNWIDLKAAKDYELEAGEFAKIDLGIAMQLPDKYEALLAPRSSTFDKFGVIQTNSIGIIDNSYCGNDDVWSLPVYALRKTSIKKGDRLCQFRIIPNMDAGFSPVNDPFTELVIVEVDDLKNENRGGYGTTGK